MLFWIVLCVTKIGKLEFSFYLFILVFLRDHVILLCIKEDRNPKNKYVF